MSHTIAHRTHVHHHVPLMPVLAVIVAIAIAAAAIYAIDLPTTTTTTSAEAVYAPAPTIVAAEPDSPVFRHALIRMGATGQLRPYLANLRHLVVGTTLDPVSTQPRAGAPVSPNYARAASGR